MSRYRIVASIMDTALALMKPPSWLRHYRLRALPTDVIAGLVVGVLVIPQSLGYAVLAGLPPQYGLYTAIVPVLVYAWIGSSNVAAVGPVAITAIMTASALHPYAQLPADRYASLASILAMLVGALLWLAAKIRLGWIMQFISRGVSAGFVSGAAVLIFVSQLKYITGIALSGSTLPQYLTSLYQHRASLHPLTTELGLLALLLLIINRFGQRWVWQTWLSKRYSVWLSRLFPLLLIVVAIGLSRYAQWPQAGVHSIGELPRGLPHVVLPHWPSLATLLTLLPSAGLMALIAFVSSSSVASTYARQRKEAFVANTELQGLGWANFLGGLCQSFAIAGGFSRTAINADSGARTPLASVVTVLVMILVLVAFSSLLAPLPYALLGATIMASIISLLDLSTLCQAWRVDRVDAASYLAAFFGVLIFGLNTGLVIGLMASFAGMIWQSSQPHIAVVGHLPDSGHFRNVNRHQVITYPNVLVMRVDESLFFSNTGAVHDCIVQALADHPEAKHVVLMMSAVNHVDLTAQEMLIKLNQELAAQDKRLHFSVIKGPVMDILKHTPVITALSGEVYLSTLQAVEQLRA